MNLTADLAQNTMQLEAELAAANERIRELEAKAEMDYAMLAGDNALIAGLKAELAVEREVSGKLVAALNDNQDAWVDLRHGALELEDKWTIGFSNQRVHAIEATLAEVAAIRTTNREKA